jgi:hypothetical protein
MIAGGLLRELDVGWHLSKIVEIFCVVHIVVGVVGIAVVAARFFVEGGGWLLQSQQFNSMAIAIFGVVLHRIGVVISSAAVGCAFIHLFV